MDVAIAGFTMNFTNRLQNMMKEGGFDSVERGVHHPAFLNLMQIALNFLCQRLYHLKYDNQLSLSDEEKQCSSKLHLSHREVASPQLETTIKIMNNQLLNFMKECMINAGYPLQESEAPHISYINFLSSCVISETAKLFSLNERNVSRQENIDCSCSASSSQDLGPTANRDHSAEKRECSSISSKIKLIETTRKHYVLHDSHKNLALKVIKSTNENSTLTSKDIKRLDTELKITEKISHPGYKSSMERIIFEGREALQSEWIPGTPLNKLNNLTMMQFFRIAREISSTLAGMHEKHIMHMNLTLENIIINPDLDRISIIGCGSAVSFGQKHCYKSNADLLEMDSSLYFISPELTGRVNREVDHRSDLYQLGVILFRLLTGKYPFESDCIYKLLHLHIFQDPISIHEINPNVPVTVSDMILKLLKKDADGRYQSCKGLIYDIDLMISEYETDKALSSITLAEHDTSERFLISQKLYSRSSSYETFLSRIDALLRQHSLELVFVSGKPGTGEYHHELESSNHTIFTIF